MLKTKEERLELLRNLAGVVTREVEKYLKDKDQGAEHTTLYEIRTLADRLSSEYREFISRKDIMSALDRIAFE